MNTTKHAPGDLRNAFDEVAEERGDGVVNFWAVMPTEEGEAPEPCQFPLMRLDVVLVGDRALGMFAHPPTLRSLLDQLRDCTDILPGSLCDQFNMGPSGVAGTATYGWAARAWLDALQDWG